LFEEFKVLNPNMDLQNPLEINRYIDGWYSAYLDGWPAEKPLSEHSFELLWLFIAKKYNELKLPGHNDYYLARLHGTTFYKYLIDRIEGRLNDPENEFEKNLKFVSLFAHGGTISGFLAAINHELWEGPYLGSTLTVELFWDS